MGDSIWATGVRGSLLHGDYHYAHYQSIPTRRAASSCVPGMPTATTTTTAPSSVLALKASTALHASSSSSTAATLRSLYPRAARAFLQRDVALTHSLLSSAFSILSSPASVVTVNDALASQRRKWDILRVTFETTLYSSPPAAQDPESLPSALRANLMLSPEPFIAALHNRSLLLFTPADSPQKSSSAFLPSQILITLVLASLKLDCIDVGRSVIEDWLAKHGQEDVPDDLKGYAKVIELYCLHVLPRLQDWDYAEDFLTYERELPSDVRQVRTYPSWLGLSHCLHPALSGTRHQFHQFFTGCAGGDTRLLWAQGAEYIRFDQHDTRL